MDVKEFASLGGKARAASLTAEEASAAGRKAANARWGTVKRAKRLAARKAGRAAKDSRKRNAA